MPINQNAAIIYEGPSAIDGAPIVAIVTGLKQASANEKTGNMLQTWIIRSDIKPSDAAKSGADSSICGDCIHRYRDMSDGKSIRTCYVNLRTPVSVYNAYKRGSYVKASTEQKKRIASVPLRLGSYGDPLAIPLDQWVDLLFNYWVGSDTGYVVPKRTGYTHLWRNPIADTQVLGISWKHLVMASADSQADTIEAQAKGWRTFEVIPLDAPEPPTGFQCPSDPTLPTHISCVKCGACNGARIHDGGSEGSRRNVSPERAARRKERNKQPASPWIRAHGPSKKRLNIIN